MTNCFASVTTLEVNADDVATGTCKTNYDCGFGALCINGECVVDFSPPELAMRDEGESPSLFRTPLYLQLDSQKPTSTLRVNPVTATISTSGVPLISSATAAFVLPLVPSLPVLMVSTCSLLVGCSAQLTFSFFRQKPSMKRLVAA